MGLSMPQQPNAPELPLHPDAGVTTLCLDQAVPLTGSNTLVQGPDRPSPTTPQAVVIEPAKASGCTNLKGSSLQTGVTADMFWHVFKDFGLDALDCSDVPLAQMTGPTRAFLTQLPRLTEGLPSALQLYTDGSFFAETA